MNIPNAVMVSIEMAPEHLARFKELSEKSGIANPGQLFVVATSLLEKCVNARLKGYLIGSVPGDAEAGKDGVIEIILSPELLALEAAKAAGVTMQ